MKIDKSEVLSIPTDKDRLRALELHNQSLSTELFEVSNKLQDANDKLLELQAELLEDKRRIIELQGGIE